MLIVRKRYTNLYDKHFVINVFLFSAYTAIQNDRNTSKNFSISPYYIEDVSNERYEDEIDLTPIQKFYDEANVFITGSTGFLGKLLILFLKYAIIE